MTAIVKLSINCVVLLPIIKMGCDGKSFDRVMKRLFYKLGYFIGEQPGYFVIIPVLMTLLCFTGFQRISVISDPEHLFTPVDGPGKMERMILEKHFPTNFDKFDPVRSSRPVRFGRLLITAQDEGSLLKSSAWEEIVHLDQIVRERLKRIFRNGGKGERDIMATFKVNFPS